MLLYVNGGGELDVADTSLSHLKRMQPQITNISNSIMVLNLLVISINTDLHNCANVLSWKTTIINKGKLLDPNTDGNLDTSDSTAGYIDGIQTKFGTIYRSLTGENKEMKTLVRRVCGTNIADIENTSAPASNNARGIRIGDSLKEII